ncbi:hypothetical protein MKW98_029970 [Papaver atlanticum]|uniref:BHLH domain-containing protein n=1 Tax=Papaver atlanticum TaxID=357466 RepID=A0AAD4TIV2_9MAGN|nr:hypothetical protein MKW98_029970 [Papaver atlanticum]
MQSDQRFYNTDAVPPLPYQGVGGVYLNATSNTIPPPGAMQIRPFNGVELQPFEVCPENFIIFDQTERRSRIIVNPVVAEKFKYSGFDVQGNNEMKDVGAEYSESSFPMKEDTADINALLSLDYEEGEEEDEEEISTARTLGSSRGCSPDSCSTYGSRPRKVRLTSSTKSFTCNSSIEKKHHKMKEVIKTLRGIVPGADEMNNAAVLDEAVKYLKSLKVEVKKQGIVKFND